MATSTYAQKTPKLVVQKLPTRSILNVVHVQPVTVDDPTEPLEVQKLTPRPVLTIAQAVQENEVTLDVATNSFEFDSESENEFADFGKAELANQPSLSRPATQTNQDVDNWPFSTQGPSVLITVATSPQSSSASVSLTQPHPLRCHPPNKSLKLPLRQLNSTLPFDIPRSYRTGFASQKSYSTLSNHPQETVTQSGNPFNLPTLVLSATDISSKPKLKSDQVVSTLKRSNAIVPRPKPKSHHNHSTEDYRSRCAFQARLPVTAALMTTVPEPFDKSSTTVKSRKQEEPVSKGVRSRNNVGKAHKMARFEFHGAIIGLMK